MSVVKVPELDGKYKFRTSGLKLLLVAKDQYFLIKQRSLSPGKP
jgi:hypothetical protein